jgi:PST family polysaccharide transporter
MSRLEGKQFSWLRNLFPMRHGLRRIAANTSWLFFDRLVRLGTGLFIGVWVARYLGPNLFGVWNYILALTALFSAIAGLGLDGIVVRELVKTPDREAEILGSAALLKLIGGVVGFGLCVATLLFIRPGDSPLVYLTAITASAYFIQCLDVIDFLFQSQLQQKFTVLARDGACVLFACLKVFLIVRQAELRYFIWAGLGETLLASLFLTAIYMKRGGHIGRWHASKSTMIALLRDSSPLILAAVMIAVYMKISQIIVGDKLGEHAMGIYSAAVRLSEIWYFAPIAIASSIFPALVRARTQGREIYIARLQQLYDFMTWMSISIALVVTFLSGWIVRILYGGQYAASANILALLTWNGVFVFLGVASSQFLLAENLNRTAFMRTAVGALTSIALSLVFIPRFGIRGAALATLASYFAATYSIAFDPRARMNIRLFVNSLNLPRIAREIVRRA